MGVFQSRPSRTGGRRQQAGDAHRIGGSQHPGTRSGDRTGSAM